jgi:hypothetical protein
VSSGNLISEPADELPVTKTGVVRDESEKSIVFAE